MHKVTLTFHLDEEVTPEIFVMRIAMACTKANAIRTGERVGVTDSPIAWQSEGVSPLDIWDDGRIIDYPHIKQVEL